MNKLKDSEDKLGVLKGELKKKTDDVVFTKRKLELLQYDLANMIKNESLNSWPEKVTKVYDKHFEGRSALKGDTNTLRKTEKESEAHSTGFGGD